MQEAVIFSWCLFMTLGQWYPKYAPRIPRDP